MNLGTYTEFNPSVLLGRVRKLGNFPMARRRKKERKKREKREKRKRKKERKEEKKGTKKIEEKLQEVILNL